MKNAEIDIDYMEGHEFEYWCAELLRQNGYSNITVTRGSGDQGVDVLAKKDGLEYAFQCKRHNQKVGLKAVQEIYAGKAMYDCDIAAVITNNYFTESAKDLARKTRVQLWDRTKVLEMSKAVEISLEKTKVTFSEKKPKGKFRLLKMCILVFVFLILISKCGSNSKNVNDYSYTEIGVSYDDAESAESALNQGEKLDGQTIKIVVKDIHPDSIYGYNIWAGEHLNFVSHDNPDVKKGERLTVKVVKARRFLFITDSWIIEYEIADTKSMNE